MWFKCYMHSWMGRSVRSIQLGHPFFRKVPQAVSFAACVSVYFKATKLLPSSSLGLAPSRSPK